MKKRFDEKLNLIVMDFGMGYDLIKYLFNQLNHKQKVEFYDSTFDTCFSLCYDGIVDDLFKKYMDGLKKESRYLEKTTQKKLGQKLLEYIPQKDYEAIFEGFFAKNDLIDITDIF